jgi:hypothetical protein
MEVIFDLKGWGIAMYPLKLMVRNFSSYLICYFAGYDIAADMNFFAGFRPRNCYESCCFAEYDIAADMNFAGFRPRNC